MNLRFCEPFGETTSDTSVLNFGETYQEQTLGLTSLQSYDHGCTCLEDTRIL